MSTNSIGYYNLLKIDKDASIEEIKKAFRKLAHEFHPDKNPDNKNAEEKFKEICRAYEVLSDPETRKLYDRTGIDDFNKFGKENFSGNPFTAGFAGFSGRGRGCGFKRGCGFRHFYNNRPGTFFQNNIKVQDISITEEEAMKGIEITVRAGNSYPDKVYSIKLPDGVKNGSLIRCVDEYNGNDFFIRINYHDKTAAC